MLILIENGDFQQYSSDILYKWLFSRGINFRYIRE